MNIDYSKLKSDLVDYLGTSINYNPVVVMEIEDVQKASNEELLNFALRYNFDLSNYTKGKSYVRYRI